jgi:hypothetical protein
MKFRIRGMENLQRNARRIAENVPEQLEAALKAEGDKLVEQVRERTPVSTGVLRDSFEATTERKRNKVVITIGTDVPYAPHVHEDLEARHEVGDAKFLESVIDEAEPHLIRAVAKRIDLKKAAR